MSIVVLYSQEFWQGLNLVGEGGGWSPLDPVQWSIIQYTFRITTLLHTHVYT